MEERGSDLLRRGGFTALAKACTAAWIGREGLSGSPSTDGAAQAGDGSAARDCGPPMANAAIIVTSKVRTFLGRRYHAIS